MANFTMEIRELVENPLINGVFTFDYDFYGNEEEKQQFEKLFIQHYYFHEIGFETPERFKHQLKAKLDLIAPYYQQLYLTEWSRVKTIDEMMTSKNLKETTEHKQSVTGENETESQGSSSSHQSDCMTQSAASSGTSKNTSSGTNNTTSSGTNTSASTTNEKQSHLADGVAQASLSDGYLTAVGESSNNSSGEATNNSNNETNSTSSSTISSTDTSDSSSSTQGTAEQSGKTTGSNKQELTESTTFTSIGDVGIQTPAYAITEWRKVLININQLMIDECKDLFMKIY